MFNTLIFLTFLGREQPPPRGCVLKRKKVKKYVALCEAAASARLCVETRCLYGVWNTYLGSRLRAAVC